MKYALYFKAGSKYDLTADEILIVYRKRSVGLIEWVKNRPENQRIIVDISNIDYDIEKDIDILAAAAEVHPALVVKLMGNIQNYDILKEKNISYFFTEFADTWDKLNSFISKGVSDVYVTNELGFSIVDVAKVCKTNNVNVRVYPNVAQTSARDTKSVNSLTKFFIRPEDTVFYTPYVDVFEFYCPVNQQDIYMDIYKKEMWTSNLGFIIKDFDKEVISSQLVRFGTSRLNCNKACSYGGCSICKRSLDFSTLLNDLNIGLVKNTPIKHYTQEEAYEKLRELSYIKESKEELEQVTETLNIAEEEKIDFLGEPYEE